jgi:MFS family permease
MAAQTITPITPSTPSQVTTHPLRNPNFRLLWVGATISVLGDQFYLVALPWLILQITSSSVALGTILMMAAGPRSVLMLVGGAVSDRVSPRKIMMMAGCMRTIFVGAVGALLWTHSLHLWHLYLLGFAFGMADAFSAPAAQAFIPSLVQPDQLTKANSTIQGSFQLVNIVGPAPAGVVVKILGTAWAFIIDAISFLFIIGALWKLPDPPMPAKDATKASVGRSIVDGLKYVNSDVALRSLLLVSAALNFCVSGPFAIGLPWIAKHLFDSPVAFSVCISSLAAGGLLGTLAAGVFRPRRRGYLVIAVCSVITLTMASVGLLLKLWLLAVVLFTDGVFVGLMNVHLVAWFQQRVEREMMGRAMSVLMFAAFGLQPITLLVASIVIKWGVIALFGLSSILLGAVTIRAAFLAPVRNIE